MSIKKYFIILLSILVALLLMYAGTAYWMGIKAQETLQQQYKMLTGIQLFKVKSHSYVRGWFSSTETTTLEFNRKLLAPYESVLPEQVRGMLGKNISYTQHIKHGPFPELNRLNFTPARALVTTEVLFSKSTSDTLKQFFGDSQPITISNRIAFSGGGELSIDVPSFVYEEALSGVKMNWKGFALNLKYKRNFVEHTTDSKMLGFTLFAAPKGSLSIGEIKYSSDAHPSKFGVIVGSTALSVGDVALHWKEKIPYKIKLNELVHLITRVRVGEFINPRGELHMSDVSLKNLNYKTTTSEQGEFINAQGNIDFEQFSFNKAVYGPMKLDVSAKHLHAETLEKLGSELAKLPVEGVDPAVLRKNYIDTLLKFGTPLLTNDPAVVLNQFSLNTPHGKINIYGQIALSGLNPSDMQNANLFIKHIDAYFDVSLPYPTLEDLVITQAHSLFMVDASAEDKPNIDDIDNLARQFFKDQMSTLSAQGYINIDANQLHTLLVLKQGSFYVNKKKVALPWEEQNN